MKTFRITLSNICFAVCGLMVGIFFFGFLREYPKSLFRQVYRILGLTGLSDTVTHSPAAFVPEQPEMDEARAFVEKKLKEHKVVVFSKTYCPYCKKAKGVLAKYNIAPEELDITELDKMDSGKAESVQDYMETLTGARSVPRVFIDGKFIGGGDDTERLDKSGKLKDILDTAGVR